MAFNKARKSVFVVAFAWLSCPMLGVAALLLALAACVGGVHTRGIRLCRYMIRSLLSASAALVSLCLYLEMETATVGQTSAVICSVTGLLDLWMWCQTPYYCTEDSSMFSNRTAAVDTHHTTVTPIMAYELFGLPMPESLEMPSERDKRKCSHG